MNVIISSDSGLDLNRDYIERENLSIFPLYINLNGKEYLDGVEVSGEDIVKFVQDNKVLPKTSAVSYQDYYDKFRLLTDEGNSVIHFGLSSDISTSVLNAKRAAENFENVYVIDSLSLSSGMGLLVMHACDMRAKGASAEDIYRSVLRRIPYVQASFVVDKLDFLHRGGRCSTLALIGANLLMIKPTIEVVNGKLVVTRKQMGSFKRCAVKYISEMLEKHNNPDTTRAFFTYSVCQQELIDLIKETIEQKKIFKEVIIARSSGTITSHCGPNCLGILYINDGGVKG